jgi:hypothetical protein
MSPEDESYLSYAMSEKKGTGGQGEGEEARPRPHQTIPGRITLSRVSSG